MPNPARIDDGLIDHLCDLAHLRIDTHRRQDLRDKLQHLVAAFSTLADADLDLADLADPNAAQPALTPETLRPDEAEPAPSPQQVLANAPRTAADCFVVPRVVDA